MSNAIVSICSGSTLPWTVIDAFLKQEPALSLQSLSFLSSPTVSSGTFRGVPSACNAALALCSPELDQNRESFAFLARNLAPGARLYVFDADAEKRDATRQASINKDLLLNGFTDSKVEAFSGVVMIQACKPSWDLGAKSALRKKPTTTAASKNWGVSANDNDELMDEDDLLTEDDKKPVATGAPDDCDVGKTGKKACKNCSCGRAELEGQGVKLTTDMLDNPTSACGSCGLGDAFRCSTCPYRGLPTFEAGKKIQLAQDLLDADI